MQIQKMSNNPATLLVHLQKPTGITMVFAKTFKLRNQRRPEQAYRDLSELLIRLSNNLYDLNWTVPELNLLGQERPQGQVIAMMYWLIHRSSSRYTVEEWQGWLAQATARQKYLKKWANQEW